MVEIYFDDLNTDAQQWILALAGIQDPAEMNWDVFPICVLEIHRD